MFNQNLTLTTKTYDVLQRTTSQYAAQSGDHPFDNLAVLSKTLTVRTNINAILRLCYNYWYICI